MRVAVAADHAGFHLKRPILEWLAAHGIAYLDLGAYSFQQEDDYPDYARTLAEAVLGGRCDLGIMICGTGQGSCMALNKFPGIRAAACADCYSARYSREHNDANVLCLGARVVGEGLALVIVETWLGAPFSGEARHQRRIAKMAELGRGES